MLTLPADRALNVMQQQMLRETVVEKEMYEATNKAKALIDRLMRGESIDDEFVPRTELPVGDETEAAPATLRSLGPLPPETLPSDDTANPFPFLEPPAG